MDSTGDGILLMTASFSIAEHLEGPFEDAVLEKWANGLREQLIGEVSLGIVFMGPPFFDHAEQVLEIIRINARVPLLLGCSSHGLIANEHEIEIGSGLVLSLFHLPGAKLKAMHLTAEEIASTQSAEAVRAKTGISRRENNGWLLLADPFHLRNDDWLTSWNEAYSPNPLLGGLAAGLAGKPESFLYLDGKVFNEGMLALSVGGDVRLEGVISQGCTPIGETWTITEVDKNKIISIANKPAFTILAETYNDLPPSIRERSKFNLFLGLVIDEYQEEFLRGDFLIRNLLAADPKGGTLTVGAYPRPGQTLQFQLRDAEAADEDLSASLALAKAALDDETIFGGCLFSCSGRGENLFGFPHHDSKMVQDSLGPFPLAGFFCNGEIGPVGNRSILHGYTAVLVLFTKKS